LVLPDNQSKMPTSKFSLLSTHYLPPTDQKS